MHRQKLLLVALNVVGGIAVLATYAWGFLGEADLGEGLWGGVPASLKPLYQVSMLLATAGYFPAFAFALRLDPERTRLLGGFGYGLLHLLYGLVLLPSALWLPLTARYLESPSEGLWWLIRLVLFAVGAGAAGILAALAGAHPRPEGWHRRLAVAGMVPFVFQTAVLDALVWPYYF